MTHSDKVREILIDKIFLPNNYLLYSTPHFTPDSLLDSIKRYGILEPIWVYDCSGIFTILHGIKRYKIALHLDLKTVPCLVFRVD